MDLKYDFIPDLAGDNAHSRQLRAVPPGSRVLEFGCATGYVSRLLRDSRGCRVTGVELLPEAAERAREVCERVVVGDLDQLELDAVFGEERFDVALFGDVLEHLKDPARTLAATRALLTPAGRVIATIPNVGHGDVRLALLANRFEYRRLGLLDETHLRFFTLDGVRRLFAEAGLTIHRIERIAAPLFSTELAVKPEDVPPEAVRFVEADPEATTYQFVVVASDEVGESELVAAQVAAEAARHEAQGLAMALGEANARVDGLAARLAEAEAAIATQQAKLAEAEAAHAATRQAVSEAETRLQTDVHAWQTEFKHLEARFLHLRRLSWINPLVWGDVLVRRLRGNMTQPTGLPEVTPRS